jgi:NTE family protein
VDGGISDNLGLRAIIDRIMIQGGMRDALATSQLEKTRRVAFVIVDAETEMKPRWGILGEIAGIGAIMDASSTILINKYNFETLDLLRRHIESWKGESEAAGHPVDFYLVHLAFNSLSEADERNYFQTIPTTLSLTAEQVDRIRAAAAKLLYSSPDFQRLVEDMRGKIVKQ